MRFGLRSRLPAPSRTCMHSSPNHENDPQWCHLVPETTRIGDEVGPGARYRFVQKFGPTRHEGTIEVLAARPPGWIHLQSAVMGARFDTEYCLEPEDGRARMIHVNRAHWTGLMRLLHPVQRKVTERIMNRQLGALKRILESPNVG